MTGRVEHTDVGAYALGLLEDDDRRVFELHLLQCPQCHEELRALQGLSTLMHGIDKRLATPESAPRADDLQALLGRCAETRRRHGRTRWLAAAAMVVVLPLGGGLIWSALSSPDPHSGGRPVASASSTDGSHTAELSSGEQFTGTSRTDVKARVALGGRSWGSEVTLQVTGVQGPLLCRLVALDHSGGEETVMSWQVAAPSGATAPPQPLVIRGSVATPRDQIDRFEVRASDGEVLSTVPIE